MEPTCWLALHAPYAVPLRYGRAISAGNFYYRHIHPDIEIEIADLDTLKLQDYDKMCKLERRYHSVREMARRRKIAEDKRKNNQNEEADGAE